MSAAVISIDRERKHLEAIDDPEGATPLDIAQCEQEDFITLTNPKNGETIQSPYDDVWAARILAKHRKGNEFAESMVKAADPYGCLIPRSSIGRRISESQRFWLHKLAVEFSVEAYEGKPEPPAAVSHPRIVKMFTSAFASKARAPKVVFDIDEPYELVLSVCGPRSKFPGSIRVLGSYGDGRRSAWFGYITKAGSFQASNRCPQKVKDFLAKLDADPHAVVAENGKKRSRCCFCNQSLTVSSSAGYGPVCAKTFGLYEEWKVASGK